MTPRWRPFSLLAWPAALLVGIVLLSGWLCFRVGRLAADDAEYARRLLWIELIGAALIVLVAMSWLGHRLRKKWLAPVERIADAVDRLAGGNPGARAELPVEAGAMYDFARRVNAYAEQVQQWSEDLRQQRADLTSATDATPDPIILTDAQQRVMLINEPAARFLSMTVRQALGQKLISILGEASLVDLYESIHELPATPPAGDGSPSTLVREIRVMREGQRFTYQAVVARTSTGGALLVLRDVTSLAQAVQMKTDFVANASHELRTPIAAIKIAFDTLSEVYTDDPESTARCIQIIGGHMGRLEAMLQDLLDLSRVENADLKPEYTDLRGVDVLAVTRSAMGPLARNKSIDLSLNVDPATLAFRSDRKLFDLIVKNLVENAIKYTPEGGRVAVTLQEAADGSQAVLRVADTGIGIPPQHRERVFERFYQVDSARSGSAGRGTGLGLAIVKHAVLALGGQVSLNSAVGHGTTVTCTFPSPGA